jgi:hypothetical protein
VTDPRLTGSRVAGYARLVVPAVALVLVAIALNASWHAIQATLRELGAPGELVVALPAVLEPAALIYAWVTIDRRRTGRDTSGVRWLLGAALTLAAAYNVASALPLDVLVPAGSVGRMVALAVSAAVAPLTVVSVGHTALEEYAAWRAARRSLTDDVHAALEAEAQQALSGQLRTEFAAEVHAAVLTRLRAEMADRLGVNTRPPELSAGVSVDTSPNMALDVPPDTVRSGGGQVTVTRTASLSATVPLDVVPDQARPVVEQHMSDGGDVTDPRLTAAVVEACGVTDRTARRYLAPLRQAIAANGQHPHDDS